MRVISFQDDFDLRTLAAPARRVREILCISESLVAGGPHFPVRYGKKSGLTIPQTRSGRPACSVHPGDLILLVFSSTDPPRAYVFQRPAERPSLLAWRATTSRPEPPAHILWLWQQDAGDILYVYTSPTLLRQRAEALRLTSDDALTQAEALAAELWADVIEGRGL